MTAKDVVRKIMADKGFSQEKLAAESGMKRQSNVTGILNRGTSLRFNSPPRAHQRISFSARKVSPCVQYAPLAMQRQKRNVISRPLMLPQEC